VERFWALILIHPALRPAVQLPFIGSNRDHGMDSNPNHPHGQVKKLQKHPPF